MIYNPTIYFDVVITDETIPESSDIKYGDLVDLIRIEDNVKQGDTVVCFTEDNNIDVAIVQEVNYYDAFAEVKLSNSERYSEDQKVNLSKAYIYRLLESDEWSLWFWHWWVRVLAAGIFVALLVFGSWWCCNKC